MSGKQASVSRRRGREIALQVLYAIDVASARPRPADWLLTERHELDERRRKVVLPDPTPIPTPDDVFEAVAAHFEMPEGARAFARELVDAVREHLESIDLAVAGHARNWRLSRMAAVDRNILRLATYELGHTDTPGAVVLNEAVDLARRFGDDPSPAFVNGILDAVARDVRQLET